MKKYDKIIAVLGVVILILAAIGIYYWGEVDMEKEPAEPEVFLAVTGTMIEELPGAISVSDSCPFYPLIVTPLAVNYNEDGEQYVVPLYVENREDPSDAVEILYEEKLDHYDVTWFEDKSPKKLSLEIAEGFWEECDAALIIEYNKSGYNLGVFATPLASYLSIPVIVTDKLDTEVKDVLEDLGVEKTIVCGNTIEGYGDVLKFEDIDEIVDMTMKVLLDKFETADPRYKIEYITITNPLDAFMPEVLSEEVILDEDGTLSSGNLLPSHILEALTGGAVTHTFTIPEDLKYALVKMDVNNLEDGENIEKFGDNIMFGGSFTGYCRSLATPAERDDNGNIEYDKFHFERVLYDMGGEEFLVRLTSSYHVIESAGYEITVTVEELDNPYYPLMRQMSSVAPYLTAYHKGLIFGKPEFAFANDDDKILHGENLPGDTQIMFNPMLIPLVNQHVYENIHKPINELVAKIKDIDITGSTEKLQGECFKDPFYIALVGDSTMLPQYFYRSPHSDPFTNAKAGQYGTNCPSDYIYGNIDPEIYSLQGYHPEHLENDLYTDFPMAENIVGRISGWDVQDASALIARTIFYDDVIESHDEEWKNTALVMTGAGCEVQRLPVFNAIQTLLGYTDPMKFPSGEKRFLVKRVAENFEKGGFEPVTLERGAAQRAGYSKAALDEMKKDGILNLLFFPKGLVQRRQGFENSESLFDLSWWKDAFSDGSGIKGEEHQMSSNLIISDSHAIWFEKEHGDIMMSSMGGPRLLYQILGRYIPITAKIGLPFRTPLEQQGAYTVRSVSATDMGPSVMLVEGCGSGKIDGLHPQNTLALAYLHAGVNAYISPTTLSAFYGALEPRFGNGVGFGIVGYLKAELDYRLRGEYPPVFFNQYMFEEAVLQMAKEDVSIGRALRDSRNKYLDAQFETEFRWTPPLSMSSMIPDDISEGISGDTTTTARGMDNYPVEKYCTIYQINLLGDPAFNPYEPINKG